MGRLALLAAGLAFGTASHAAERVVRVMTPPSIRPGIAALPAIVEPADDAERRINVALRHLDAAVRNAAAACRSYGRPGSWQRTVETAMAGPGFLSLVIRDESFCDGAHPNSDLMSIVYDLRTGRPVDWRNLLPADVAGTPRLLAGSDGTKVVTLASPWLFEAYLAGYRADAVPDEDRQSCREAIRAEGSEHPPQMMAWLDARGGGLAVQFSLPHVVQACAEAVVIPASALRQQGAAPELLAAFGKR